MKLVPERGETSNPVHLPGGSIPRNTPPESNGSIIPRRPFRVNPEQPDPELLEQLYRDGGLAAVWRHGCDAGMVAS